MAKAIVSNLIWIDLEMTGLDVSKDTIIQVAVVPTDRQLEKLDPGLEITIHQPDEVLEHMDQWCIEHHGKSGLTEKSRESTISMSQAEERILEYVRLFVPSQKGILCGNSVHNDRYFLMQYMPTLHSYFHYRTIDVTTVKELVRRWFPETPLHVGRDLHQSLSDIDDSIEELKYYRKMVFKDIP